MSRPAWTRRRTRWLTPTPPPVKTSPQRLPRTVVPWPDEKLASYLNRLAWANQLDAEALRSYLTEDHRKSAPVPVERLSILTGLPARTLRYAILGLCSQQELADMKIAGRPVRMANSDMACRHCTLARGHQQSVWRRRHHEDVVCFRHLRWIGPGTLETDASQPDLSHQPDILQAARRHRRLIQRHGKDRVDRAYIDAQLICERWHEWHHHEEDFLRKMEIFHGPEWRVPRQDATVYASTYPQVIALTRILASPYWRSLAFEEVPRPRRFVAEICRTVAPNYRWTPYTHHRRREALADWIDDQLERADRPNLDNYQIAENLLARRGLADLSVSDLAEQIHRNGLVAAYDLLASRSPEPRPGDSGAPL